MANAISTGDYREYATVNTAPGSGGFWTNTIGMRGKHISSMFFNIRGTGNAKVTLQFKCHGDDDWTDYNNGADFVIGDNKIIEGNGGDMVWRAGVKQADYSSGSVTFGFTW